MSRTLKKFADYYIEQKLQQYDFFYSKFQRILLTMFKWKNLPDGISKRFLEATLFDNGLIVFYKHPNLGHYLISKGSPVGQNAYEEPIAFHVNNAVGDNFILKRDECVPIWNNYLRLPSTNEVSYFAKKLDNIETTINVNLEQLKNPYIISCPEGQEVTVREMLRKKSSGEPYIIANEKNAQLINVNVFDLHIQNNVSDLQDIEAQVNNEALTYFGINNVNVVKKERLVTGEAEQNDEQISLAKETMLSCRQDAVKEINEKFNLDITVSINEKEVAKNVDK